MSTLAHDERNLWLPPRRMRRYQWSKVAGGLLIALIFVGWMVIQWSNSTMRVFAIVMIAGTAWITLRSVVLDSRRSHGQQLAVEAGALVVITPDERRRIAVTTIARAQWRNDPTPTMTLFDANGRTLATLDESFFANEAEARTFLGWARRQTDLPFEVIWPKADA